MNTPARYLLRIPALALAVFLSTFATASTSVAADGTEIMLWPNGAPGSEGRPNAERVVGNGQIAGIHQPSLTVYLPAPDKATGAAVIVIAGGGHRLLSIQHEGFNVGAWLKERGIAAFVLKHRLAREEGSTYRIEVESFADTERAIRLVRSRAQEWGIDPARVGALGFSAGGELVAMAAMRSGPGAADAADPIDRHDAKPAFQALIYPGVSRNIIPTADSPPAFLLAGYNDRPDISEGLANVYLLFKKAGVSAELHIYSEMGHGFGLRATTPAPGGLWPFRLHEWMQARNFIPRVQ
mgnify:CR=1 FL=1